MDIALLKIGTDKSKIDDLPFHDIVAAAKTQLATQCHADILLGRPAPRPPLVQQANQSANQSASLKPSNENTCVTAKVKQDK